MEVVKTVLTIVQVILAVILIAAITLQSGKSSGLGAISGSADTFLAKNQNATLDAKLTKATKWISVIFVVLTLVLTMLLTQF